jgi:hypothetical protein
MVNDNNGAPAYAIEPLIAVPDAIIAPALSVVVEVLEKIADNLVAPKSK